MNQELERFDPSELGGRIAYEHLHRYGICRDRAGGLRVLDVACGAGYGTNLLAEVAAEATGVDIDSKAIRRAKRKYKRDNLKFVTADCCDLPFEDNAFDVVVANEVIEHIDEQDRLLEEAARVLKPGGILFVSTPNKPVYNRYKTPNPFHVSELDAFEFRRLLNRHFEHVTFTGLRMALVSAAFELDQPERQSNLAAAKTYRGASRNADEPTIVNDELSFEDPEYILACCSDRPIEHATEHSTIFFSRDDDLWLEHEKIMAWASQLHEEDEVLRADLRRARAEIDQSKTALEEARRTSEELAIASTTEHTQHLKLSSRLLSRLTKVPVEEDPVAVVDALFALNEQLATQRARLESLAEAAGRVGDLERKLEISSSEREQLQDELRSARLRMEDMKLALERSHGDLERLGTELRDSRNECENFRNRLLAAGDELEGLRLSSASRIDDLQRELGEARAAVAKLKQEWQEAAAAQKAKEDLAQESKREAARKQIANAHQRGQSRLFASRFRIQKELAGARSAIEPLLPAPPSDSSISLLQRVTRLHPLRKTPLFDKDWVRAQLGDGESVSISRLLKDPDYFRVDPHPLFEAANYLERYPDVVEAGVSPLQHYLEHGWREGREPHPYFANNWYLKTNPDVLEAQINPLEHYLLYGWREGRRPNPVFSPKAYLALHSDVREAGIEPLTHYVRFGRAENREIPVDGLERGWRDFLSNLEGDETSLMDFLLSQAGAELAPPLDLGLLGEDWPPVPLNDYWLPQGIRDFLVAAHGEDVVPRYSFFYSVMNAYEGEPGEFPDSLACQNILERVRRKSNERASAQRGTPAASIILPVYNNFLDTLLCLASVFELDSDATFEIIVADDASDDATSELVPTIGGVVRYLRQSNNLGFLANCNSAAEIASGRTIIFLNNDTLVLPGWLDALLSTFDGSHDIGLVGSKLINWDGTLQEAGGIFWSDGSAWNFGRGEDALAPEYNYLKDVDYCSGASIAVPAELWRELKGFDALFSPAYCEDSDLAFRLRACGYRVVYQPHSEVIHHEGRSHGRDIGSGVKASQIENQQLMAKRWCTVLDRDHFPNAENVLLARDRSANKPHVLFIDHYVPQWDRDAGSRTIYQYMKLLLEDGCAVTFWPDNLFQDPVYTSVLQALGVEVIYGPRFVGRFVEFIRDRAELYDLVFISRPHVAKKYLSDIRANSKALIAYYGQDLHFKRLEAAAALGEEVSGEQIASMRSLEVDVCDRSDVIFYPDPEEISLMQRLVGGPREFIANPVFVYDDRELADGRTKLDRIAAPAMGRLLFVGGFNHTPNRDGIIWFARNVLPLIRVHYPSATLEIVGSNAQDDVLELASEAVIVHGLVSDDRLDQCYDETDLVVAPLRYGAGIKGKVIEAMAKGVPVATTSFGAQGIPEPESKMFLGDDEKDLAEAVMSALRDRSEARNRCAKALEFIAGSYSRSSFKTLFGQFLTKSPK